MSVLLEHFLAVVSIFSNVSKVGAVNKNELENKLHLNTNCLIKRHVNRFSCSATRRLGTEMKLASS